MIVLFEGMDGSGKSTVLKAVAFALEEQGQVVAEHAFPSHTGPIGRFIRDELFTGKQKVEESAMLYLMQADGLDRDPKVADLDEESNYVLLDRHPTVSAWAYQLDEHLVSTLATAASPTNYEVYPAIIFIVDVPAEVSMERRKKRGEPTNELFEKDLERANVIRSRYAGFAGMNSGYGPVMMIDGTLPVDELVSLVLETLDELS